MAPGSDAGACRGDCGQGGLAERALRKKTAGRETEEHLDRGME